MSASSPASLPVSGHRPASLARAFALGAAVAALAFALWPRPAQADGGPERLTSRPRLPAPPARPVAVGDDITTGAGQRRRVRLPDGSILYVNADTRATLQAPRRLKLTSGEIYLEAADRPGKARDEAFLVRTPHREVSLRAAHVAVQVTQADISVLVTRGQVQVSGSERPILAGQQVRGGKAARAPRASHALAWARDLMIAAESPLVPASKHAGGTLVARDPSGQEASLTLRKYHIDVHIEDGFARTTIDQTYFNDSPSQLEGTFYFPLPPDASLSRLAMYVEGEDGLCQLMEGGMAEADHARQVYETIRYANRDPALLEWLDGSTFKMRVFPLEGRKEKRLLLSYTQRLDSLYGRTTYRFPAGHSLQTVRDWSFHARLKGGAEVAHSSPSHTLKATRAGKDLLLDASAKGAKVDRDAVLLLADPRRAGDAEAATRFASAEHEGAKYLMVRYRPELSGEANPRRRDWVFLCETSGDRDPLLARVQIDLIRHLLAQADPDDTFVVLSAGTRVRPFAPEPRPATPANIEAALTFLERAHLVGALDLGKALSEAAGFLKKGSSPYLVHLGSGIAAMGERRQDVLVKRLPEGTRYVGIGVGRRWNRALMKAAAERTGGLLAQVNPDEPVAWRAFDLFATLNTPRLLNVTVADADSGQAWLCHATALAQGEEVCAVARLGAADKGPPRSLVVRGLLAGKPYEQVLPVQAVSPGADYLPRTWAKLEIDRLLAEDAGKHRARVVALSKAMYVMTPFTSLLVLENDDLYTQYKVDRGRKDHWAMYAAPAKIAAVYEPDPDQVDPRLLKSGKKLPARQVVQTILGRMHGQTATARPRGETAMSPLPTLPADESTGLPLNAPLGFRLESAFSRQTQLRTETETFAAQRENMSREPDKVRGSQPLVAFYVGMFNGHSNSIGSESGSPEILSARQPGMINDNLQSSIPTVGSDRIRVLALNQVIEGRVNADRKEPVFLSGMNNAVDPVFYQGSVRAFNSFSNGDTGTFANSRVKPLPTGGVAGITFETPRLQYTFEHSLWQSHGVDIDQLLKARTRQAPLPIQSLLYSRPGYREDPRLFADLMAYTPGMDTSGADVLAVLEAEALPNPAIRPGKIDPAARKLLDAARVTGWQCWTIATKDVSTPTVVLFDGKGRFAYERALTLGLKERVVCDGKTLLHLYSQLGIGARRTVSRFHRADFAAAVPWVLPPVEDLARGADVQCTDARTVALIPRGAATAKTKDGKPASYARVHLIFGDDGRLAERQIVRMPKGEVLLREVCSPAGVVRVLDRKGKELLVRKGTLAPAKAPDLKPDTKSLVVLPLPYRTADHVRRALKLEKKAVPQMRFDEALPLFAAAVGAGNTSEATTIFQQVYHAREQRQLGFYVLLAACGANLDAQNLDVLAEHLDEPVAQYLALHSSPVLRKHASQWAVVSGQWGDGFLKHLAVSHALYQRWQNPKLLQGNSARVKAEVQRALDYVRRQKRTAWGWALLCLMQDRAGKDKALHAALAECFPLFEDVPGLHYAARYEQARSLWHAGQPAEARQGFAKLYADTLKDGQLPPIDGDFRLALVGDADRWGTLLRATAVKLVEGKHRPAVLALAWQCWQLGDRPLANHLLGTALHGVKDEKERLGMSLAGLGFLWQTAQLPQADTLLAELLAHKEWGRHAGLWRLAGKIAARRDRSARALECLERALELEYRKLPDVIDLQAVRTDYGELLGHYQKLADAMVTLKVEPPAGFLAKAVRAADRWRALDRDPGPACQAVARILRRLGEPDLGWDYLTTPVGLRPNEAEPWVALAEGLSHTGDLRLADRAYAAAFEAEPTNAQILWDRAQNLRQAGQNVEATRLLRRIAAGRWQPRFQGLQAQARLQVQGEP